MAIRTHQLNLRIDPQIKYMGELAAIQKRASLSTLVSDSIRSAVDLTTIYEDGKATSLSSLTQELWAEHEADRFAKLADRLPHLLTPAQSELWERVAGEQKYWKAALSAGEWNVSSATFNFEALRNDWPLLTAAKDGE